MTQQRPDMKWVSPLLTITLAALALSVQWGVLSTRLTGVESRLDELIAETRIAREQMIDLERRVSRLEGMAQ